MKNKRSITTIIFLLSIWYTLPILAQNEPMAESPGDPNIRGANIVDVNLAKFAALHYARKFYSEMYVYGVETYYDLNDQPAVYAITLISEPNLKPSIEEVENNTQQAYKAMKSLRESIREVVSQATSGKAKSRKITELRTRLQGLQKQLTQDDRFTTLLCGATEDHVPVIRAFRGLSEHVTSLPSIQDKIVSTPELSNMRLSRIYYLGMFDQWYSLEPSNRSAERIESAAGNGNSDRRLVHLRRNDVNSIPEIWRRISDRRAAKRAERLRMNSEERRLISVHEQERKNRIKEKWSRIRLLYQQQSIHKRETGPIQEEEIRREEIENDRSGLDPTKPKNNLPTPLPSSERKR
jgi:hypothetical protein